MEEKYKILLEKDGNGYQRIIQIKELTDDVTITFSDFSDNDMPDLKISRTGLTSNKGKIKTVIAASVYNEISRCGKIRAKINDEEGIFAFTGCDLYIWEKILQPPGSPFLHSVIVTKEDYKHVNVKVLFTYNTNIMSVTIPDFYKETERNKKYIIGKALYSGKSFIKIICRGTFQQPENYEIPVIEFEKADSMVVLSEVSKYRKYLNSKPANKIEEVQAQQDSPKEEETKVRKGDDRYLHEQIDQQRGLISAKDEQIKSLDEELRKLRNDKKRLESLNDDSNKRLTSIIAERNNFAEKYKNVEILDATIAELKPYQEFYKQYAESKLIEEIKLDFEQLARYRQDIENLSKSKDFPEEQKIAETFGAFTELNRILIFEVEANDRILDKIASYEPQFNSSLGEFRNLLSRINQSIIDSCKHTEDFSLKMIPAQIMEVLAHPNNYLIIEKFNHSFLDLNIRFNEFTEAGWNTLLRVLENLRKLVYIKSVI
jgi:hypothetical protein